MRLPTSYGGGRGLNFPTPKRPGNKTRLEPHDGLTFVSGRCAEEGERASMCAVLLTLFGRGIYTLLDLLPSFLSDGGPIFGSLYMPGDCIYKCDSMILSPFCKYCTSPRDIYRGLSGGVFGGWDATGVGI